MKSILAYWQQSDLFEKVLYVSGTILFVSMIVHGAMMFTGRLPLHGPVSFRKAATFAETGWLMCWAVGWCFRQLRLTSWEKWSISAGTLMFGLGETLVMTIQVWRGVPSHYNFATPFDNILISIGGIITPFFAISMLILLIASLRPQQPAAPSIRLSIQAGTGLMIIGALSGFWMFAAMGGVWQGAFFNFAAFGELALDRYAGPAEGAVGGNIVIVHAMGVHGLSLVPLAAWLLTYSTLPERQRWLIVATAAAGWYAMTGLLTVQMLRVLPLTSIDALTGLLLTISTVVALGALAAAAWFAMPHMLKQRPAEAA